LDLRDHVAVVVVAEGAGEFLVVHGRLALAPAPHPRHFFRINQLKLTVITDPLDDCHACGVGQQLQQKLPQLNLGTSYQAPQ